MRIFQSTLSDDNTQGLPSQIRYVDVAILTGQSNANGTGLNTEASATELLPNAGMPIYNTSANRFQSLEIGVNNIGSALARHGIELGMSINNTKPLYLIKWALTSTCIVNHLPGGTVYDNLYPNYVVEGINQLISLGYTPRVSIIFIQGECDSNSSGNVAAYPANFDTWVAQWKSNLGNDLPFYIVEIIESNTDDEAINAVFAAKALTEPNMTVFDTSDHTTDDGLHYNYAYLKILGDRIITAIEANPGVAITSPL